ncbi:hypothetical protein SDRG_03016 [Saprolegnia diclina VS20]|uniref:Uncharacterized protein n=1 Tax=Saprolegnia diclina (strain VS20) TaxID=1156394 RepID=T0S9X8_SAPDV|nr:hypothetical protein SDRG_03016 [Saprolegnia diclina VS20]EQC39582.1 hypothetical protein SDRG_03016 [Saprolegnia diclina VS20]|eukprot:XP_008606854.1 hypothetical protein SDRG_03016 [Saprolegnia diclina VS20]
MIIILRRSTNIAPPSLPASAFPSPPASAIPRRILRGFDALPACGMEARLHDAQRCRSTTPRTSNDANDRGVPNAGGLRLREHGTRDMILLAPARRDDATATTESLASRTRGLAPGPLYRIGNLRTTRVLQDWAARGHVRSFLRRRAHVRERHAAARRDQSLRVVAAMNDLVDEVVRTELIPDLLIELFTSQTTAIEASPRQKEAVEAVYGDVLDSAVRSLLLDIVHTTIQRLVQEFLQTTTTVVPDEDPLESLMEALLTDLLRPRLLDVVHETIAHLVTSYLTDTDASSVYAALLMDELRSVVLSAHHDEQCHSVWSIVCAETLPSLLSEMATVAVEEARDANAVLLMVKDRALIEDASTSLLNHALLSSMLQLLAQQGDRILFQDACEQMLSQAMLAALLKRLVRTEASVDRTSRVLVDMRNRILQHHLAELLSVCVATDLDAYEAQLAELEGD